MFAFAGSASAYTLSIERYNTDTIYVGDIFKLNVFIDLNYGSEGKPLEQMESAYFTIRFNYGTSNTIIDFNGDIDPYGAITSGVTYGSSVSGSGWYNAAFYDDPYKIMLALEGVDYLDPNASLHKFLLATIDFKAFMAGSSTLIFDDVAVYGPFSNEPMEGGGWNPTDVTVNNTPSSVPEPSTILLLGLGIAGLIAGRRKAS